MDTSLFTDITCTPASLAWQRVRAALLLLSWFLMRTPRMAVGALLALPTSMAITACCMARGAIRGCDGGLDVRLNNHAA